MKKIVCLSLILFVCVVKTYAQVDYKYALKVYSVHSFGKSSILGTSAYYFLNPSFGFQWQGKKPRQWHEVQFRQGAVSTYKTSYYFSDLNGQQRFTEGRMYYNMLDVSYENNWYLFKTPHKLMPSLGVGVQGEYTLSTYNDSNSDSRINGWGGTTTTYFVPRLTYNISPRLFLDVNAQINLLSLRLDGAKNVNTYNKTNVSTLNTEVNFLQNNTLKLGLGYRF